MIKNIVFALSLICTLGCKVVSLNDLDENSQLGAQAAALVSNDWCAAVLQQGMFSDKDMFDCLLRVKVNPKTSSDLRVKNTVKISCKSRSNQTLKTTNTLNCEFRDDYISCDKERYLFNIDRNTLYTDLVENISSFARCTSAQSQSFSYDIF